MKKILIVSFCLSLQIPYLFNFAFQYFMEKFSISYIENDL